MDIFFFAVLLSERRSSFMTNKAGTNHNDTFGCGRLFLYILLILMSPQEVDVLTVDPNDIGLENFTSSSDAKFVVLNVGAIG